MQHFVNIINEHIIEILEERNIVRNGSVSKYKFSQYGEKIK